MITFQHVRKKWGGSEAGGVTESLLESRKKICNEVEINKNKHRKKYLQLKHALDKN